MSQDNVEIVRQVMEAFNQGDKDAWFLLHDPEFEFRADPKWPESGTIRGREAAWDFAMSLNDAWESDPFEMVDVIEAGDDKVVARFRRTVRGKASGIADVLDQWCVVTVGRGKVLSQEWFTNRAEALGAAELSE